MIIMADEEINLDSIEEALEVFKSIKEENSEVTIDLQADFYEQILNEIGSLKSELNLTRLLLDKFYLALNDTIGEGKKLWPRDIRAIPALNDHLDGLIEEYESTRLKQIGGGH